MKHQEGWLTKTVAGGVRQIEMVLDRYTSQNLTKLAIENQDITHKIRKKARRKRKRKRKKEEKRNSFLATKKRQMENSKLRSRRSGIEADASERG